MRSDTERVEVESRRRLVLAIAISIALHEVAAGLVPRSVAELAPHEVVTHARILQISLRPVATAAPPRPKVRATDHPQIVHSRHAYHIARAGGHPIAPSHGLARQRVLPELSRSKPVWDVANGTPSSHALLAGSGNAPTGAANGSSAPGNGTGARSGEEPCGFVTFSDPHGSHYDPRTGGFWVDIRMSVHFADRTSQSLVLDYPWYYPSEAANPWSDQNLKDPSFPMRFQSPPSDRVGGEPPLVQYVLAHSTHDGLTLLKDCPSSTATPAARHRAQRALSGLAASDQSPMLQVILFVSAVPLG